MSDAARRWLLAAAALSLLGAGMWNLPVEWRATREAGFLPYVAVACLGLAIGLVAGEIRHTSAFAPPHAAPGSPLLPRFTWREAFVVAGFALWILAGVELLWMRTALLSALLAGGSIAMGVVWRTRADRIVYLFAGVLGPFMEWVCIRKWNFWQYRPEMGGVPEWGIPLWLPMVWGYLFVLFRRLAILGTGSLSIAPLRAAVLLLFGGYFLVSMQLVMPAIGMAYAIVLVLTVCLWRTEGDLLMFLVSGFLGTLGEYLSVQRDLWSYGPMATIQSIHMPISLPFAWGFSGVLIRRFAEQWDAAPAKP